MENAKWKIKIFNNYKLEDDTSVAWEENAKWLTRVFNNYTSEDDVNAF